MRTGIAISCTAALLFLAAAAAPSRAALVIEIGDAAGPPGSQAALAVRLRSDGDPVTGLRHDLVLPDVARLAPRPGRPDRPDCRLNPDLLPGEAGAGFYWGFTTCPGAADCNRPLAEVVTSRAYFPDDVTLYTCTLAIAADAAQGTYGIDCSFVDTSDGQGNPIAASCAAGALLVDAGLPPATLPPTVAVSTPTPTATPCADCGPLLEVGTARGVPGERVEFPVTLWVGAETMSGLQADIAFPSAAPIPPRLDRKPDCTFGDGLGGWSDLAFQPPGALLSGEPVTGIRALILSIESDAIADGAVVLTCSVDIASDAVPGRYPLSVTNLLGTDPDGHEIALPGRDGAVEVLAPSQGEQPVVDAGAAVGASSGGCAVTGAATPGAWLLLPLALLWVRRRRTPR